MSTFGDRLGDDLLQSVLEHLDKLNLQHVKCCSSFFRTAARRAFQAPRLAERRKLALRESEFNGPNISIKTKRHGRRLEVTIDKTVSNGTTQTEQSQALLDWLSTGPDTSQLVGLQDWSLASVQAALACIIHGWALVYEEGGDDDDDDDDATADDDDEMLDPTGALNHRVFDMLSLWDDAEIRAKAQAVWMRLEVLPYVGDYDRDVGSELEGHMEWLDTEASRHPTLVAQVLHADLASDNGLGDQILSYALDSCLSVADVALSVEDALIFMTTADEDSWPNGQSYNASYHTGYPISAGCVLQEWAKRSKMTGPSEFVDALVHFCCHPVWRSRDENGEPRLYLDRVIDDYLLQLVCSFARTDTDDSTGRMVLDQHIEAHFRACLLGSEASLREALLACPCLKELDRCVQRGPPWRPRHLSRCFQDNTALVALTHPDKHFLWPMEWTIHRWSGTHEPLQSTD